APGAAPRFEADRRAAGRSLARQGRQAPIALGGGAAGPADAARGLGRGARPTRPELARRREVQRGDRPGRGGRTGVGRGPAQKLRSALVTAGARKSTTERAAAATTPTATTGTRRHSR